MTNKVSILTTASCFPKKILTNADLEKMVETTDQWIVERTGIRERRIASADEEEWPSDLAARAAKKALEEIDFDPNTIDGIICATMTPDYPAPGVAYLVQKKLGLTNQCMAFDLGAACSGFVYAFNTATSYIKSGFLHNVLVIGSDCTSVYTDYRDRNTCILFGDGAGVALLSSRSDGQGDVLGFSLGANGHNGSFISVKNGGCAHPITKDNVEDRDRFLRMQGRETFKNAVKVMEENSLETIARVGLKLEDIHWMIPHQANKRILEAVAQRMGFPSEKVIMNIERFGNTTAATIPTCLDEGIRDGRIQRGQYVLFTAFGAGLSWGSTVLRY
ncbi:MAG: ketoacyl-ACP synthase III [Bacteriovoracales bacterium]|nr:ketoacyl-ACP synthase III [Bacteriovoracales bacterium]